MDRLSCLRQVSASVARLGSLVNFSFRLLFWRLHDSRSPRGVLAVRSANDSTTRDMFPAHIKRERDRLNLQATDRRERASFFRRMGYVASASKLEDEATRIEGRALRLFE